MASTPNEKSLDRRVEAARELLTGLIERAGSPADHQALLHEALKNLSKLIEELQVSSDELAWQNDQLIAARGLVEAERQYYQELFEFAPDAYIVTDMAGPLHPAERP